MVNIYLIRHAQSTGNVEKRLTGREQYLLTSNGKKQVEKLTHFLKNIKFENAYSSPSIRAIDTIKPLAELNKLKVETIEELSEMYFGIYDGFKWEEVNKINSKIHENHMKTNEIQGILNQETSEQVANRMYKIVSKIVCKNLGKTILIASHGVAIEAFLRKITKVPFLKEREEYSQKNTSINIIQYDEEKKEYKLQVLNNTEHLQQ